MPVSDVVAVIQSWDAHGHALITQRFKLALAPGLHAALGQTREFYGVLCALTVSSAVIGRWRSVPVVTMSALLAVGLSIALAWPAGAIVERTPPVALTATPVPAEWRLVWQDGSSFPSRHALAAAALAGTMLLAWPPLGIAGYLLAVAGGLTAMFFGAAWLSDVVAGLALGTVSAIAARSLSGLLAGLVARNWRPIAGPQTPVVRSYSRAS